MNNPNSKTFCLYPFTHINWKANGQIGVCNRCDPMGKVSDLKSIDDFWHGEEVKKIREKQSQGIWPEECRACKDLEDSGSTSYRQESLLDESIHHNWVKGIDFTDQSNQFKAREIELRFGNLCNLQCMMCSPKFSSQWENSVKSNPEFQSWIQKDKENFDIYDINRLESKEELQQANEFILTSLESKSLDIDRVLFSGGEPLLQKDHYRCLEVLLPQAHKITLEYTSNLNYLNFEKYDVLELWKKFKHIYIKVSLDADPYLYSYLRRKGNIDLVTKNIKKVHQTLDSKKMTFVGTCTTSAYNIERLPEIMTFFNELGMYTHTSIVEYPTFLSPQTLPENLKLEINNKLETFLSHLQSDTLPQSDLAKRFDPEKQRLRTIKWVKNCKNYLMGGDNSTEWAHFLNYNSFFDSNNSKLFELYPHWKNFK